MKITVGANIKRLRTEKNVTQEQLAEAMNVTCAAVSKWERGDSYPDITLLQPLAFYFDVSLDELVGYDKEKVNEQIEKIVEEYRRTWDRDLMKKAYREYPNDYRIMYYYMWTLGVEDAEPDLDAALLHKDELEAICDKIIGGCTDGWLRLGAWKMKAILLHAEGKTEEALKIHDEKCGSWYQSCGQMNEQLFKKNRPEFLYWAARNMYELVDFGADKLVKSQFFNTEIPYEEMVGRLEKIGDELYRLGCEMNEAYLIEQARSLFGRLNNDLHHRKFRGAKDEDVIRIFEKDLAATAKIDEMAKTDAPLRDMIEKCYRTDSLLDKTLDFYRSTTNPRNVELLKNERFRAALEKYAK